jgi:hypothetical protein
MSGPSYTGQLIDLLVAERDVDVRLSLAHAISCELTCNGTEPCAEARTVEEHLDNLLIAYKRAQSESVGEEELELQQIFTYYAGDNDSDQCLSPKARQRIREFRARD